MSEFYVRNRVLKGHKLKKTLAFFACAFALLLANLVQAQQRLTPQTEQTLRAAYAKIKNPEISFEKFAQINSHAVQSSVSSKDATALAQQDTYCANLKTYCANGDFESGLDQTAWTGAYGFDYSGITPNPFTLTYGYVSGAITDGNAHQTIVLASSGNDPIVPAIPQVAANGGTRALRLGNAVTGNGTEVLAKTITVDANETILNFYYAVVFQDPNHVYNDQPAFSVRVYDCATGLELTGVCNLGNNSNVVVSDASNPFFSTYSSSTYGTIAYKNWSQAQINMSAHIGKKVTIIFETKDCNLGGHFGYAYLDNIFSNKCPIGGLVLNGQGSISLDSASTSSCGTGQICAKYTLPSSNTATGTVNISLAIYQSGSLVTTLTSGVLSSGSSYCFNINPATLGLNSGLGGFDYALTGNFALSGFSLSPIVVGNPPNGQVAGANNDYNIACNTFYSKSTGDLSNLATWGVNPDGSGTNPTDFGAGKTFTLANRSGVYTLTSNWSVGGTIVNASGNVLQINGNTLSLTDLSGGGTLSGSLTSNLTVMGTAGGGVTLNFTAGAGMLNNLTLNRTGSGAAATVGSTPLSLYNVLMVSTGTLNTGNVLTLKSTASNTARVAAVTGTITGSVMVERYIPARRAWRILSAPVGGSQTIQSALQEGATTTSANPVPNYGTFITGGSSADGFDQSSGATSSMKTYNSASGWVGIANTNATAVNAAAYMTFVYGNRNSVTIPTNTTPANTTLRSFGPLKTGDQTFAVAATGFTAVPNPFASPINFATLTRTNVANSFYLWDPKVGGTYGVGAYVTVSFNGSTYDVSSNAISPESQYIQSGQGFLVYPSVSGTPGSIVIKESDKSNTAATDVFRSASGGRGDVVSNTPVFADPTQGEGLRMNLQKVNVDGTAAIVDEVFSSYKANYSDKIDEFDALKPANVAENLGITRGGQVFSIERRTLPAEGDNIQLSVSNTETGSYALEFNPVNLKTTGLYAYLKDNYLNSLTPVSLSEVSKVYFGVNANPASAKENRFAVLLSKTKLDVITTTNGIMAYPNPVVGKTINLQFANQPKGAYMITIINSAGKVLLEKSVQHSGSTSVQTLQLSSKLPTGVYQVRIAGKESISTVQILCTNQ